MPPPSPSSSPPRIGLSLIVRNGATTLPRLLAPFAGRNWEIAAVDTGSTDDSIAVLREHGARVIDRPWDDDFSAARNAALDAGSAPWVLSLDADEWLDDEDPSRIEEATCNPEIDAYVLETINYVNYEDPATTRPTTGAAAVIAPHWFLSSKVRLFRRHGPDYIDANDSTRDLSGARVPGDRDIDARVLDARWEGPVHELVDFSAKRAGYRIARTPIRVHHDGLLRGRDPENYGGRAERAVVEGTAHPGILLIVALRHLKRGDVVKAESILREARAAEPAYGAPAVWLARLLGESGRQEDARALLLEALQSTTGDADVLAEIITIAEQTGDEGTVRVMRELATRIHPGHPYWP